MDQNYWLDQYSLQLCSEDSRLFDKCIIVSNHLEVATLLDPVDWCINTGKKEIETSIGRWLRYCSLT